MVRFIPPCVLVIACGGSVDSTERGVAGPGVPRETPSPTASDPPTAAPSATAAIPPSEIPTAPPNTSDPAPEPSNRGTSPPPPLLAAGDWWLIGFEDPIGIALGGEGGTLRGSACLGGFGPEPPLLVEACGAITGTYVNRDLEFTVPVFRDTPYAAKTRVSVDGTRMTGEFYGVAGYRVPWSTSWLRIPAGFGRPPSSPDTFLDRLPRGVGFTLVEGPDIGEFNRNTSYRAIFARGFGITGDLGSFMDTEMTFPKSPGEPLLVGPVSPTFDHLPIELRIELDAMNTPREITALTASGNRYRFEVTAVTR